MRFSCSLCTISLALAVTFGTSVNAAAIPEVRYKPMSKALYEALKYRFLPGVPGFSFGQPRILIVRPGESKPTVNSTGRTDPGDVEEEDIEEDAESRQRQGGTGNDGGKNGITDGRIVGKPSEDEKTKSEPSKYEPQVGPAKYQPQVGPAPSPVRPATKPTSTPGKLPVKPSTSKHDQANLPPPSAVLPFNPQPNRPLIDSLGSPTTRIYNELERWSIVTSTYRFYSLLPSMLPVNCEAAEPETLVKYLFDFPTRGFLYMGDDAPEPRKQTVIIDHPVAPGEAYLGPADLKDLRTLNATRPVSSNTTTPTTSETETGFKAPFYTFPYNLDNGVPLCTLPNQVPEMCTDHPKFKGYPSRPLKDEDFLAADLSFDCPKSLDELVEKVMVWYNEKISVEWVPTPKMTREEVLLGLRQLGLEGV